MRISHNQQLVVVCFNWDALTFHPLLQNIQTPFLEAVKITLGDRYTEKMETIYRITINFIISNISSALAAHLELANNDHGLIKNTTGSIGVKDA